MSENVFGRNGQRIGRKVIFERSFDHAHRVVSYGISASMAARPAFEDALHSLAEAQRFGEVDAGGPVSLELVATVQHGWPIAHSYTLHFEVIPCAASQES